MIHRRSCPWCQSVFTPHPRLGKRQKCCGSAGCKKKQKNLSHARWKAAHPALYRANQKDWRLAHPDYWRNYRANHPAYVEQNRVQSRIRKTLSLNATGLQKRIDILQLPVNQGFLWNVPRFAKSPRSLIPILFARSSSITIGGSHAQKHQTQTIP